MRVAIIGSRGLPPRYGGFEVFAHHLAEKFSEKDFKTVVYCFSSLRAENYNLENVKRIFITPFPVKSLQKMYVSSIATIRAVFFEKVDVIIFLGASAGFLMWLPRAFSIYTIFNPDGFEWKRARWRPAGRLLLKFLEFLSVKFASKIVYDSRAIGSYIKATYKKDGIFVPYGCSDCLTDEEKWREIEKEYNITKNGYYLVVGRAVAENNLHIIYEGFLKSNTSKKLVFIVNTTPAGLTRNERVVFTGSIFDRKKLNTLRKNAFAYIHGHSVGGTNPSLLESIGCNNLVIAYDVPFNREVLGDAGLYFDSADTLKEIIEKLECGIPLDTNEILKYYDKIKNDIYNWSKVTGKYAEIVEAAI